MATKMTVNGESTTTAPGTEPYETFYSALCRYKGKLHKQLRQRRLTEFATLFIH